MKRKECYLNYTLVKRSNISSPGRRGRLVGGGGGGGRSAEQAYACSLRGERPVSLKINYSQRVHRIATLGKN